MNQSEKNRNPSKWRSNDNPRKYSVSCKLAKIIPTTGRKTGVAMTRKFYGEPRKATLHYPPAPEFAGRKIPIESCRSPLYGLFRQAAKLRNCKQDGPNATGTEWKVREKRNQFAVWHTNGIRESQSFPKNPIRKHRKSSKIRAYEAQR